MTNFSDLATCRLCQGATTFAYKTIVLDKHEVSYYCCQECGSLQTEPPYWLAEAYEKASQSIDPGSARRVLDSYVLVYVVAWLFSCRKLLDFGGNTGFLSRLLRDQGFDAYSFDGYVVPTYTPQFVGSPLDRYELVSAFEVLEHFDCPAKDLEQIFGRRPNIVLATTELFSGQTAEWWYLAPREGQHIFFYSEKAARLIATHYGYNLLIGPTFLLFSRDPFTALQRKLIPLLVKPRILRVLGAILLMRQGQGAQKDFNDLTQRRSPN
jgi:Methyltransferase domain